MKDNYDVIVAGAGPAGSIAAKVAAENGLSVLLIEKKQEIGEPVRCAEGLICEDLGGFIEPDPRWICARIRRLSVFSKGIALNFKDDHDVIYISDRKIFDRELARSAASAGAEVLTKTQATGLIMDGGQVRGITGKCCGDDFSAGSKVVIAADGIESRVSRWAGINTKLGLKDVASASQYHLTGIDIDPEMIELHYNSEKVPGGYAWVFPKGDGESNVGLCILNDGARPRRAVDCLDDFVRQRFPDAGVLASMSGAVPVCGRLQQLSSGGIVAVGDAGRLCDPLTGEGILNGMISGRIAGDVAAGCINAGDTSAIALRQYDREVAKELGPSLDRNYILKEHLRKASDMEYSLMFRAAKTMGAEKYPMSALLREAFHPRSKRAAALVRLFTR